jgi:capsular polysaccharide biosynthesis protein
MNKAKVRIYQFVKSSPRVSRILRPVWEFAPAILNLPKVLFSKKYKRPDVIPNTREWFEAQGQGTQNVKYHLVNPPEANQFPQPPTLEEDRDWINSLETYVETAKTFVLSLPKGRVWGEGNIVTHDDKLLLDLSSTFYYSENRKYVVHRDALVVKDENGLKLRENVHKIPPVKKLKGRALVLAVHGGRGYYHWMIEVLPRLYLVEKAGYKIEDFDHIIINSKTAGFVKESLDFFGIPESKIVETHWLPHLQADELIVPSIVGEPFIVPKWACEYLHEKFRPYLRKQRPGKKIFISRAKAAHRRILNETQLREYLKNQGFEILMMEKIDLLEKAKILSEASLIVSTHGAGLSNLVFCHPGTTVIEFTHHTILSPPFWNIGANLGMNYFFVRSTPLNTPNYFEELAKIDQRTAFTLDIQIDIEKLDRTLQLATGLATSQPHKK